MKKIILINTVLIAAFSFGLISCDDWTEPEAIDILVRTHTDEYYENLRAWKATMHDREVSFGYYGTWTGAGASLKNCMSGLPDSTDLISLWGPWHPHSFTDAKKNDFNYARKVKGLKVMACSFADNVGDGLTPAGENKDAFWGWDGSDADKQEAAIRKYARAFADSVIKADFDGLDIDYEPTRGASGNLVSFPSRMHIFIDELGKFLGPKSGTGRLLCVDGDPERLLGETSVYLDYFIYQAYNNQSRGTSDTALDGLVKRCIDKFASYMTPDEVAAKFIVVENWEVYAHTGGYASYKNRWNEVMLSLKGFAGWQPYFGGKPLLRKGGAGTYHMEYEYSVANHDGFYPFLREAIAIMNPPQLD